MSARAGGGEALGDVLVLGLGKTGTNVGRYLARRLGGRVSSVTVCGGASSREGGDARELRRAGARVLLGTEDVGGSYDLAITSPGIPESSSFVTAARESARELVGEPEFAWREDPERWVGITGTNGKTTTTTFTRDLLVACGMDAVAVGNIGNLATEALETRAPGQWFVAELSSFQLAGTSRFHPRVACILNVTPDHIEWHGSMEAYAAAKERVFANLTADDLAVVASRDAWCAAMVGRLRERGLRVCEVTPAGDPGGACAAFVRDGELVVRLDGDEATLAPVGRLSVEGDHNVTNVLVAATVALELGAPRELLARALADLRPLEHRIEPCGELGGVRFVNDSKATNVDAAEKALGSFSDGTVVLLAGGHDKGTELSPLARAARRSCAAVVCFGEAGPRMAHAFGEAGVADVREAAGLEAAFGVACDVARPGQVVLLSPACSSFDEFGGFEERGTFFKGLVAARVSAGEA